MQPEIKELLEQVINKLRNDPCCYLYYLEKVFLHNMYDNEKVSCLTKLDARYIFPNIKFFSLYPLLDISVNELYIEPIYKIIKVVDHINFDEESYNDCFIERTKDIIDRYRLLFLFGAYGSGKTILSKEEICVKGYEELIASSTDAAKEKHVPVVTKKCKQVKVDVGSVMHPMSEEHLIEWVAIETE